jgi:hypothetical protein
MTPKVLHWDQHYANDRERQLAAAANTESGLPDLEHRSIASYKTT